MMQTLLCVLCLAVAGCRAAELLRNGDMEVLDGWNSCWGFLCSLVDPGDSRFGSHSIKAYNRTQQWMGPSQNIQTAPNHFYSAESWIKLLNDKDGSVGQILELMVSFEFPDGQHSYANIAHKPLIRTADGWVLLKGDFQTPSAPVKTTNFYYQGPEPGVDFMVDSASITDMSVVGNWRADTDAAIETHRKSNISVRVTTAARVDASQVQIQVVQKKKSFPFGTAVNSWKYVEQTAPAQKYRDFLHQHFNWAVMENALKWDQLERQQGQLVYDRAIRTIDGLNSHGVKVRGHNLVWSVDQFVPDWVRAQSGDQLRETVRKHIEWTCNITKNTLQHWDVNNENLHGHWFQNRLNDVDYDLELFRISHQYCSETKLFLNDYGVVAEGSGTKAYLDQGLKFKNANVNMYGMGVQCHFARDTDPSPILVKQRLDTLAQVGVPLWATELTVETEDENKRADQYELALRALYAHPAVEGILFWGFWDQAHYAGIRSALAAGDDVHMTAAGRRVFDMLENQWMTDETRVLSQSGNQFTVRGFHGDYEVHVRYQGQDLSSLKQTFTLDKADHTVHLNVHV